MLLSTLWSWNLDLPHNSTVPIHFPYYVYIHSNKRTCKVGCGEEITTGQCDTPGFPLSDCVKVEHDHRHTQKLYMPRNHRRLHQTSTVMLQSWRGNCDVQILIYDCSPKAPNVSEIARVTDYVVAYSCKGNATLKEEIQQNLKLSIACVK